VASIEQGGINFSGSTVIGIVNIAPYTILGNGQTTVTTAGTAVQLSTGAIKTVTIRALETNTGKIYIGTSSVTSSNGFQLGSGETVSLDIASLGSIYVNSTVNGEGVSWITLS
jgi:hypothetical protein